MLHFPKTGQVYEHTDGGSVYVVERKANVVVYTRRPPGDSEAKIERCYVGRFREMVTGLLSESAA